MSEQRASGERDPLSRPLPSVGMPLLASQVRAARAKRVAAVALMGLAAAGGVAYAIFGGDGEEEEPPVEAAALPAESEPDGEDLGAVDDEALVLPEEPPAPEPPTPVESDDGLQRYEATFGEARGFRPALLAAGLSNDECISLETALDGVLDFRRCRPDQRMIYQRDFDGNLVTFEYHDQPTSFARAERDPEGELRAQRVEREVEIQRVSRGGTVRSSLGDAVESTGLGRGVVGVFVEVFDGKVNFATQARAGDQFRVVLDQEMLEGRFLRWGQVRAVEYVGQRAGTLRSYYFEHRDRGDWYDEDGRQIRGSWLRVPCRYDRISSPYNPRRMHPLLRRIVPHNGVDFAASTGTPVWAAADGEITWAGPKGPNGNLVSIRHEGGWESHYAHLHRIQRGIARGTEVRQRQLIGTVGSTGRSTGPHLHFGLKRNGRFTNPIDVLNGPGRMLPAGPLGRYRRLMRELTTELHAVELGQAPRPDPEPEPETDESLD